MRELFTQVWDCAPMRWLLLLSFGAYVVYATVAKVSANALLAIS